jgi:U32 family peptidase
MGFSTVACGIPKTVGGAQSGQVDRRDISRATPDRSHDPGIVLLRRLELLAPGGDIDAIKAAIVAGADAIYCGLDKFNARGRAANIGFEDLGGVLALAHRHDCRVFLTLNVMMVESDISLVVGLLNRLVNTSIDGVIIQDLGLLQLLAEHYPSLEVHASTQLTTHNEGQISFLARLGVGRVNLARELDLGEIRALTAAGHRVDMGTEVFVHGSYCLGFSGICTLSSVHGFDSGNRGRCSQPCRARYETTPAGVDHPLNLVDNAAYGDVKELWEAGVDALKIEGRIKKFPYVYTVTRAWRQQLERLYQQVPLRSDSPELHAVFNRGFSNGYLRGRVSRDMFVDNPRNQAAQQLRDRAGPGPDETTNRPIEDAYDEISELAAKARRAISRISTARPAVRIDISGEAGTPLRVDVERPEGSFSVTSDLHLVPRSETSTAPRLDADLLRERLEVVGDTEYRIERLEAEQLRPGLFLPFREIKRIKERLLFVLNGSRAPVIPIDPADLALPRHPAIASPPALAVLVSSERDLELGQGTDAELHFQLPSSLPAGLPAAVELFTRNRALTPWFPAILFGEDYAAAVELLRRAKPSRLVTDNTGIAWEAAKAGIPWIAGPQLNIANSHSLRCLSQRFGCAGAFVSFELSVFQIRRLRPPEDFGLFYSIYHPMRLLTSRQCLLHQVSGCDKDRVDASCLGRCERSASLSNLRGDSFLVHKAKGEYSSLYFGEHFLNTGIVADLPGLFSGFLVDLRDVETQTRVQEDKAGLIARFEGLLRGQPGAAQELERLISPTTCELYEKGV